MKNLTVWVRLKRPLFIPCELIPSTDRQHDMFCKAIGKFPPPMPEIMADDEFEVKAVLDLGCGSGSW
jgi:hypothetical protein